MTTIKQQKKDKESNTNLTIIKCRNCSLSKNENDAARYFYKNSNNKSGFETRCKDCFNKNQKNLDKNKKDKNESETGKRICKGKCQSAKEQIPIPLSKFPEKGKNGNSRYVECEECRALKINKQTAAKDATK